MDGIVREFLVLADSPLEFIGPGILSLHFVIAGIRFRPGIGIAEELISQYRIRGIPVHQPIRFGSINGVLIVLRIKSRAISGGHIPHLQVEIRRVHGDGAATGDRIVGGSVATVAGFYLCTGSQVLLIITTYVGRGIAALAGGIGAFGGNGIGDVTGVQGIPVHQLSAVVLRRPAGHISFAVGLRSISIDGQGLPEDFNISIDRFQVIPVQSLGPIFLHIEYIEGPVTIRSCLIVICTGVLFIAIGSSCLSICPTTGNSHGIRSGFGSIGTGHVGQIIGFLEIAELGHIDILAGGILIGGRGAQQTPQLVGKGISISLLLASPGNGDHRRHLEDKLVAAGISIGADIMTSCIYVKFISGRFPS